MKTIKLTKFEYDYLMAQVKVDVVINHQTEMIRMGYFKSMSYWFRETNNGKKYIEISTIRDLEPFFEIVEEAQK